jgi:hypothetical protein
MKIQNNSLSNKEVHFSVGAVQFDENGVADVQPEEFAKSVLELDGFFPVEEEVKAEEPKKEAEKSTKKTK